MNSNVNASGYRKLVMFDLAEEFEVGFFLSYYRNFSIPHIARTLAGTGEVEARPAKRSFDTAIVMYELIEDGVDGERGKAMVDLLRRVHHGVPGTNQDFLYVLATLLVVPIRYCDAFGRRATTQDEKAAALHFYNDLASRLGIEDVWKTYEESEQFLDRYENEYSGQSAEGARLMTATMSLFGDRLPRMAVPLAPGILSVLLDDARLSKALGLPTKSDLMGAVLRLALKLRGVQLRRRAPRASSRFTPGDAGSAVYPRGYEIKDLGPRGHVESE